MKKSKKISLLENVTKNLPSTVNIIKSNGGKIS